MRGEYKDTLEALVKHYRNGQQKLMEKLQLIIKKNLIKYQMIK